MAKRRNNAFLIDWTKLVLGIGLCLGAGALGSVFTTPAIAGWYQGLVKPAFNPPDWIFGPVWTTLFILMGIALYLVWTSNSQKRVAAQKIFYTQLGFNVTWSYLFFGFHNPTLALLDIAALWIAIFLTIRAFVPISKTAAYLLFPYLVWVSFAAVLNATIVLLN
ncbi:hypothetical protein A2875_01945 [Candidatus Gottesmanbacteria bacterium RIFCSPHIGHO2_01_FULL_46_14]|uniref:TspO protein n=2 Tax=Candidatus Gottesmaniibacteriota TaxID=1752720 RepID=A0A1F5ZK22_9BACT|nr:MAG: hypothetical protein A2875_01945 [Candidatus Gottesmanbacteria bacterium RIFCSPHIGHO2_01_FULL_46_14]OGG28731.1 MAG: hypothetical protein A2971_00175 [Candidatus Gottesmanbacteria bacterium RIFCSPLOWO2_01_FULL_46_21]